MKDYVLEIKVKNNYMKTKMRERGIDTAAELARRTGLTQPAVSVLLTLKVSALTKRGKWRQSLLKVAEYFNCLPEELVPPQHLEESLSRNTTTLEVSRVDLKKIASWAMQDKAVVDPLLLLAQGEAVEGVQNALGHLKPRERHVITMRFGLDDEPPATLDEVAESMGVTRERIRQIEAKGIRRLTHPVAQNKFALESHMQTFEDVASY